MHLRSYRILQTSLHGGPQIFLKFCTHSYISERNLPWKFQLSDAYGCRDMNTLRFETKLRFAKSRKRKIAIISEIFIKNLQILKCSKFYSLSNKNNYVILNINPGFEIWKVWKKIYPSLRRNSKNAYIQKFLKLYFSDSPKHVLWDSNNFIMAYMRFSLIICI